jgi:dipeptidase E
MKLVAIGGGEIRRLETLSIDRKIVELTGEKKPKALFVPTSQGDPDNYCLTFASVYGEKLGCKIEVLKLVRDKPSFREIKRKTLSADLIYAGGGGNTLRMMRIWRNSGFADVVREAAIRGTVLSGLSAGGICWFRYGNSDYRRLNAPKNSGTRIKGLGLVNATFSPHHLQDNHRMKNLKKIMRRTPGVGLAVDDFAAIEINGDKYRILKSKRHATVKRVYYSRGKLIQEPVTVSRKPRPLIELIEQ